MISVVLTSYNYASFLTRAIDAVLHQSVKASEFIIIDDDSTDSSLEIIKEYARSNLQIKIVKNDSNKGVIWSINYGLKVATNPFILFATADDIVHSDLIEKSLVLLTRYPSAAFFTAAVDIMDKQGNQLERWSSHSSNKKEYVNQEESRNQMNRRGFWFAGATSVFRRQMIVEAGGFMPELGHYCDSFISQVLALRHGYCYSQKSLAAIRMDKSSYSQAIKVNITMEKELQYNVIKLMKTKYSDLFPPKFIDEWSKVNKLISAIYSKRAEIAKKQEFFQNNNIFLSFFLKIFFWFQFLIFAMYVTAIYGRGRLFFQYISFTRLWLWLRR